MPCMQQNFRKITRVRLINGIDVIGRITVIGEGHNLQEHYVILVRWGGVKCLRELDII